jgi:hypothetical protein
MPQRLPQAVVDKRRVDSDAKRYRDPREDRSMLGLDLACRKVSSLSASNGKSTMKLVPTRSENSSIGKLPLRSPYSRQALSALATVAIGTFEKLGNRWLPIVAMAATGVASILGAWESLFSNRKLWRVNNAALTGLYEIKSGCGGGVGGLLHPRLLQVSRIVQRLASVMLQQIERSERGGQASVNRREHRAPGRTSLRDCLRMARYRISRKI